MKHLKLFFALFAMLALGVGNAWGADYSTTHTSNVTLVEGNKGTASSVIINGTTYDAMKLGTSSVVGVTTFEVPTGTSKIHLHVASWKGQSTKINLSANNGITLGTTSITSTADNGVTGNGPYTIASTDNVSTSYYKEVEITSGATTSPTTITITTTSSGYRAVIWGVNAETAGGGETPDPTTYTIKWHTAVGTYTEETLTAGTTITEPVTVPTMTGYEFMGWTDQCNVATDGAGFTALSDFGTADSDKDFYAVFAVATVTEGAGGGETGSVTMKYSGSTTNMSSGNNAATVGLDANKWSVVPTKGSADNMPGLNKAGDIRLYGHASGGNYLTISSASYTITDIIVTYTGDSYKNGKIYVGDNNVTASSGTTYNINASEFVIKNGNSSTTQVRIKTLVINYSTGGGSISYNNYITTCSGSTPVENLTDAQFAWSAATAEATMGASNTFPTLTNTLPVSVTYESSTPATATIDATSGAITLVAPGTTTISAKFAGGEVSGTTYAAKTVKYDLTVLKAPATPTENVYVKVTETAGITDGEYLIVYEDATSTPKAPVAFNGSLTTLDAAGNMMSVTITDNVINGNTEIDEVTFTISAMTGGYAIKSKSGKYIGRTSSSNGMNTGNSEILNIITITDGKTTISGSGDGASTSLQYYSVSGSERFRYYSSNQKPIALYKKVDPSEILAPAFSVAAGSYYDAQSVEITCATAGVEIYYTLDGSTPSSTSTKYTSAVAISETKTLKAIAIKGEYSSSVTEATYTILAPLATMQEIFDKATAVGNTATPVKVTMNNWVVTGVKGSNAYLTDGTKGLIIYKSSHGFVVGDVLSGTVACKVQLYNGSSELTELTNTTEGLTVTTGGTVAPVVVNDVTTLSGVNTGSVIKITGVCEKKTINDKDYYYVANVQLYNSLFAYTNPTVGNKYNVTGVYLQYNEIPEILPRSAVDIEEIIDLPTATISIADITMEVGETKIIEAAITPDAAQSTVQYAITSGSEYITLDGTTITAVAAGEATITATIAEVAGVYNGATKTFSITVKPQNIAILPFEFTGVKADIEKTLGMSQEGLGSDYTTAGVTTKLKFDGTGDCVIIHFNGQAEKLAYEIKGNGFSGGKFTVQQSADGSVYTDVVTYTELGDAATKEHELAAESRYVKFIYTEKSSGNVGLGNITISKADLRQETGLAWNPATVSLTVGDAFTAPTFSNPNSVTDITFTSDNEDLATVTDAGVITLKEDVTGKAVITANFAGNEDYKSAEVTTTIIVSPETGDVVILAKHQGKWYAMKAEYPTIDGSEKKDRLAAVPVYYVNGKLYNVSEEDKAAITWTRSAYGDKVSFQNNGKYLKGKSSTTLILEANEDGLYKWNADDNTMIIGETTRTFLYHKDGIFRNYSITLARETSLTYSNLPVVTAPEFATGNVYTINASATNGTAKGADTYVEGSTVTLMADPAMDYTFVNWTKGGEVVSTSNPYVFTANEDLDLVANFAKISQTSNTLSGTFSVGQYEVAQFATGNLQYNVKDKEWSFAKQQYQYIGDANINVGDPDFTGTIDLFGWSNGENNNFGANQSGNKNDYKGEFVDWGTLFPAEDNWSTLSHEQWDYLLNKRGAGKKQIARVGTVFGVMLFPDVWNAPLTVEAQYDNYFKINVYNYTLDQWTKLEKAGAVFFPAAGRRYGGYGNKYIYDGITNLGDEYKLQYCTNDLAAYYTSTKHSDGERVSYLLNLGNGGAKYSTLELGWYEYGHVGQSVRLAKVTDVYTRTVTPGNYGTICLPYAVNNYTGATFYEVAGKEGNKIVFDEVTELEAGKPYIFMAEAAEIRLVQVGEEYTGSAKLHNSLQGTFTQIDPAVDNILVGNYMLVNNIIKKCGKNCGLNANRAYFVATELENNLGAAPQPMPGRRRVTMGVTGENEATGVDNITENGVIAPKKLIENGQLIIIRNGEKFNAQGVRF